METALLFLSLSTFLGLVFIGVLFNKNIKLQKQISVMKLAVEKANKEQEELVSIDIGDKAILPNYGLQHTDTKEEFNVTYEVEILEVSTERVKVKAIDFTSSDKFARDPKNKKAIILFLQDKWINKKEIELIIDDSTRRDRKLQQILNN